MKLYSEYSRHLIAVDCIIFGYDIREKQIKLLLIKRNFEPAIGKWSLAGGFVKDDENLDDAACRVLHKLTGLKNIYMKQLYAYGDVNRDPGARVISVTYSALIKIQDIDKERKEKNGAQWHSIARLPHLIFDHTSMVKRALKELQLQSKVKPVGFELLPEKFTLVQLQDMYEAVFQQTIDKRNFRKKMLSMDIIEKLEEKEKETSKKGAFYYRFNRERYKLLRKQGYYFSLEMSGTDQKTER